MRYQKPVARRAAFRVAAAFFVSAACLAASSAWAQSDPGVVKTGPNPAFAGANLTYTITATNAAGSTADTITMTDTTPAGTTFVSLAQAGPAYSCTTPVAGASGTVTCVSSAPVPANGSTVFTMVVNASPALAFGTIFTNTANVSGTLVDTFAGNNSSAVPTFIVTQADLAVSKSAITPAVAGGANLQYTITLSNLGPSNAQGVQLVDAVPVGTTFVGGSQTTGPAFTCASPGGVLTCDIATLAAGAVATFNMQVSIPASTAAGTLISNTAAASTSGTAEGDPSNNSSTANTSVTTSADISVLKTAPATVVAGNNMTYGITVANAGPSDAAVFNVSDALPAGTTYVSGNQTSGPALSCTTPAVGTNGLVSCSLATFAAGSSATFDLVVNVSPGVASGSNLFNAAAVSAATTDPNGANNASPAATAVSTVADLSVAKSGPATVNAGSNITYTVTVGNAGPSNATTVTLTDVMPAFTSFVSGNQTSGPAFSCSLPAVGTNGTITCSIASLGASQSATFELVVNLPSAGAPGATLSNTATVGSATTDGAPGDNSSTTNATVTGSADLAITKTGTNPITAGGNATYQVSVTNNGPSDAQTVNVSDTLPGTMTFVSGVQDSGPPFACTLPAVGSGGTISCNIATLPSGATASFTLVGMANASLASGSTVSNTATITASTTDGTPGNNSAMANALVVTSADLSITKTGAATVSAGNTLTYAVTVANAGASDAQSVVLTDVLPAGTTFVSGSQTSGPAFVCTLPAAGATGTISCTIPTLASGASAVFSLVVTVVPATANGSTISNTATVSSATTDPAPGNNSATSNATVSTSADILVSKTGPASVSTGANIAYLITVSNLGPSDAQAVVLADALPVGTTFVSGSQSSGPPFTCTLPPVGAAGTVTCNLVTMPAGSSAIFSLVINAGPTLIGGSVVSNTATASSTTTDGVPGNNSGTATTNILAITSFSGPSPTGTGTITASFTGGGPACAFNSAQFVPASSVGPGPPQGTQFPHGLFEFTASGCIPGSTLNFTIAYPDNIDRTYLVKYGPTAARPAAHWYTFPGAVSGFTATFSITDGGLGDRDLAANGTVSDPIGPAIGSLVGIPTLSEWMQLLLAAVMLAVGAGAMRRRAGLR